MIINISRNFILRKKIFFNLLAVRQNSSDVRVRFAPSPTGKLHIGGLRTAFYNYLFAKKYNGKFLLRIEDTDQERLQKDSLVNIVEGLKWCNIEADYGPHKQNDDDIKQGGPWLQSKRLDIYHKHVDTLLEKKKAYKCFCDETRLELLRKNAAKKLEKIGYDGKCRNLSDETIKENESKGKPYVIRFKLEDRDVIYNDLTTGLHKSNPYKQEGDFIIIKSDKYPTYHFANVVDDHLMKISHVLRGQEWQLSTSKHISIYEAFGWVPPVYCHLPLIFNMNGTKLSKRQNDIDVLSFRDQGYLPETLLAYLSTIGGGVTLNVYEDNDCFKSSDQVISILTKHFDESKISAKSVKLNQELLEILNRRFIRLKWSEKEGKEELLDIVKNLIRNKFQSAINEKYLTDKYLTSVINWAQDRIIRLNDLVNDKSFSFLWTDISNFSIENKSLPQEHMIELIEYLVDILSKMENHEPDLSNLLKDRIKEFKVIKKYNNWELVRLLLIGAPKGPPVVDIFNLLGRENIIDRLKMAKDLLSKS